MNLSQRTSLSLLFVSLSAVSANAALSGDNGAADISIEKSAQNSALQPLDQLLGGGTHADLFGSVLKQHEESAHPAKTTMEGHFERDGSQQPVGLQELLTAASTDSAQAPNLSLASLAHSGAEGETSAASASSASSSAPTAPIDALGTAPSLAPISLTYTTSITPTNNSANPVPLPAAGLLLASGLIGVTGLRRRQRQE
jgi:hypothetical protein